MGPDGEDGLFAFLQGKLKDWQASLNSYKPLAETGNYPGKEEIARRPDAHQQAAGRQGQLQVHRAVQPLKKDLLDFAERYHDLEHFYDHQKPTWEKLRKANERFQLNRLELERDAQAAPALQRIISLALS